MKYVRKFLGEFRKTSVFSTADVRRFLVSEGASPTYALVFINSMIRRGKAFCLAKGIYTLYRDIEVAGFAFSPFYYGLGFALTKHRLWKQQANLHVLTTRNVRRGSRVVLGTNINVSKISKRMFFGYVYVKGANFYYPVSDIEKTLIDCIYYRFSLEDYVYESIFAKLDSRKMKVYLRQCSTRVKAGYKNLKEKYSHVASPSEVARKKNPKMS